MSGLGEKVIINVNNTFISWGPYSEFKYYIMVIKIIIIIDNNKQYGRRVAHFFKCFPWPLVDCGTYVKSTR